MGIAVIHTSKTIAMVGLSSQAERDLSAFEAKCRGWSLVRECHMLNGEIDFILKIVSKDLQSFQEFLTSKLTPAPNVASVKTTLVIRRVKFEPGVPITQLRKPGEARATRTRHGSSSRPSSRK